MHKGWKNVLFKTWTFGQNGIPPKIAMPWKTAWGFLVFMKYVIFIVVIDWLQTISWKHGTYGKRGAVTHYKWRKNPCLKKHSRTLKNRFSLNESNFTGTSWQCWEPDKERLRKETFLFLTIISRVESYIFRGIL